MTSTPQEHNSSDVLNLFTRIENKVPREDMVQLLRICRDERELLQDSLRDFSSIPDLKRKCNLLQSDTFCDYGFQKHDILSDDETWKGVLYARNPVHAIQQKLSLL